MRALLSSVRSTCMMRAPIVVPRPCVRGLPEHVAAGGAQLFVEAAATRVPQSPSGVITTPAALRLAPM
jgi:hypothetical protein